MATAVSTSTEYAAGGTTVDGLSLSANSVVIQTLEGQHTLSYSSDIIGVEVDNLTDCVVRGFDIDGFTRRGIDCFETSADGATVTRHLFTLNFIHDILLDTGNAPTGIWASGAQLYVLQNVIDNIHDDGIFLRGQNSVVTGNVIKRVSQGGSTVGDCIQLSGAVDGSLVSFNYCDHSDVASKQCIIVNGTGSGGAVVDNYCKMLNSVSAVSCLFINNPTWEVARNFCDGGDRSIRWSTSAGGSVGAGNVSTGFALYGHEVTGSNVEVYQATIDGGARGVQVNGNLTGVVVKNAIIVNASLFAIVAESANDVDYLAMYNNTGNVGFSGGASGALTISNQFTADPQFRDATALDYRLESTSPYVGAGTMWWTPGAPPRGEDGLRFYTAPSLGAYEVRRDKPYTRSMASYAMKPLEMSSDILKARRM